MKLSLVFCIIGGLVSCSLQQVRPFRSGWFPNSFQRARLPYYYFDDHQDADITEMDPSLYELPTNEVQGRPAALSPFFKTWKSSNNPQSRFFGFMLYNQLKNSLLFPSVSTVTFTSTSTSFFTTVSTITTVSIQNCISSSFFSIGSSADCPIKKRSIELNAVEPSKVLPMESSRMARNLNEPNSEPYFISSSFSDDQAESDVVAPRQFAGGLFPSYSKVFPRIPTSIQVVMVTSTTTSFSLIASAVKKPFAIAASGALSCVPPGFILC